MSLGVSTSDSATVNYYGFFRPDQAAHDGAIIGDTETIGYTSVKTDTGFASATLNQITFEKEIHGLWLR